MIKYLGEEKNVSLSEKNKRKKIGRNFLLSPFFFTLKMVKNDVFLGKPSAKWDFIVGARLEHERRDSNK